jgi:hypothetical protein
VLVHSIVAGYSCFFSFISCSFHVTLPPPFFLNCSLPLPRAQTLATCLFHPHHELPKVALRSSAVLFPVCPSLPCVVGQVKKATKKGNVCRVSGRCAARAFALSGTPSLARFSPRAEPAVEGTPHAHVRSPLPGVVVG